MLSSESLRRLRDDFDGSIPEGTVRDGDFKVRKNWWIALIGYVWLALDQGEIKDPETEKLANEFLDDYMRDGENEKFHCRPTSAQDIERADQLITAIVGKE